MTASTIAVYVGTYHKYNCGSIEGQWLDLTDYANHDEFMEACRALHADEEDPELMFQDFEGFPYAYYGESYISPEVWAYIAKCEELGMDVVDAGLKCGIALQNIEDAYCGQYDSDRAFAMDLADACGFEPSDTWPACHIDWDAAARHLMMDHDVCDGHYFSTYY